jgi:hypothetical protein
MWKAVEGLAEASNSFGIPAEQSLRVGQGIKDIMEEDYKRGMFQILGWSPYYIDGKEKAPSKSFFAPDTKSSGSFFK